MQRLQQTMCPRQGAGYALVVPLKGMPATLRLKLTFRPTSFESPHHAGMVNLCKSYYISQTWTTRCLQYDSMKLNIACDCMRQIAPADPQPPAAHPTKAV